MKKLMVVIGTVIAIAIIFAGGMFVGNSMIAFRSMWANKRPNLKERKAHSSPMTQAGIAQDRLSIKTILQERGSFAFTDGSSVYNFAKDGTFTLSPCKWLAKCITGTWTNSYYAEAAATDKVQWCRGTFVVQGRWFQNGICKIDDCREMTLEIQLDDSKPIKRTREQVDLYDVYFTIEDLHPITSSGHTYEAHQ